MFAGLGKPVLSAGIKVFRFFVLSVYKFYWLFMIKFGSLAAPAKNMFFYAFTNRYTIHAVIIAIAIFTGASSISAYEVRDENYGEGSLLYFLVGNEGEELIEEGLDLETLSREKTYKHRTDSFGAINQFNSMKVRSYVWSFKMGND